VSDKLLMPCMFLSDGVIWLLFWNLFLIQIAVLDVSQLFTGRVSAQQAAMAYDFNNLIFTAARVPQIIKNFQVRRLVTAHVASQQWALLSTQSVGFVLDTYHCPRFSDSCL